MQCVEVRYRHKGNMSGHFSLGFGVITLNINVIVLFDIWHFGAVHLEFGPESCSKKFST